MDTAERDEIVESCPSDVVHAPVERVWELVSDPSRFQWLDARVCTAPGRVLRVGDRVVLAATLGLRVTWDVLAMDPRRSIALDIGLPFGLVNHETIVIGTIDAERCRVTFN
jgi:hypothetical protein